MYQSLSPNLMVENVAAALEFYKSKLGAEVLMTVPEEAPYDWGMVRLDEINIMFQAKASLVGEYPRFDGRPIGASLTLYISVSDVAALYERLKNQVTVTVAPHRTFYGAHEFAIEDNNGYVLVFSQRENA